MINQRYKKPLAYKWSRQRVHENDARKNMIFCRDVLDNLQPYQIIWEPYSQEVLNALPEWCRRGQNVWMVKVPLIFGIYPEEAQHLKKLIQDYIASFIKVGDKEKELGRTTIEPEVFKKTHVRKKENKSDPDVWVEERAERTFNDFHKYVAENLDSSVQLTPELSTQIWKEKVVGGTHKGRCYGLGSRNDVRRLQSGLEGIGSSRQAEALDGVQIAAMSDQITKLTAALAKSEWKRVAEQQSMSETV
ncbi:uncharacterized protein LOC125868656 [Solanum stenotomum]|uniref:uncharacterized protein LOC125868656 n=1 Tax=Solanum stenotomum TaxID=172797 RepID=UPI0020D1D08D|nr:uncharacterized protein LOC125868656 [Solanum stenotomum]